MKFSSETYQNKCGFRRETIGAVNKDGMPRWLEEVPDLKNDDVDCYDGPVPIVMDQTGRRGSKEAYIGGAAWIIAACARHRAKGGSRSP